MIVTCYSCSTSFKLDDSLVKPSGTRVRCSRCKHFFILYPPDPVSGEQPKPRFDIASDTLSDNLTTETPPDLEFDANEFHHLELAGFEFDDDNESPESEDFAQDFSATAPPQQLDVPVSHDENDPELEIELDSLGVELEEDTETDAFDTLEFGLDEIDPPPEYQPQPQTQPAHTDSISFDDDDPEFELELCSDPDPGPPPVPPSVPSQDNQAVDQPIEDFDNQTMTETGRIDIEKPDTDELPPDIENVPEPDTVFKKPILILLPFLFIAVIASAFLASKMTGYQIPFISDLNLYSSQAADKAPAAPVPSSDDVSGRFITNTNSGKLFVITGKVENPSNVSYSHIQVKASLIAKDQAEPKVGFAFCGNIIPEKMLESGNIKDITAALAVKKGTQAPNMGIKPGASIPYMIVFADVSEKHESFTVQVNSYESE